MRTIVTALLAGVLILYILLMAGIINLHKNQSSMPCPNCGTQLLEREGRLIPADPEKWRRR